MTNNPRQDLAARVRQLMANDRNAGSIYEALSKATDDKEIADQLAALAAEEAGHMRLDNEMLELIEKETSE